MAIQLKQLVIDTTKTIGSDLQLVEVREAFAYEDKRKTDKISGYSYVLLVPALGYDKISVKVDGSVPAFPVGECEKLLSVTVDGLEMRAWQDFTSGNIRVSCTAKSIKEIKGNAA